MVDEMTWKACMSSEIFREYYAAETKREAEQLRCVEAAKKDELERKINDEHETWQELAEFRKKVAESPALKAKLVQAKAYLEEHPEMVDKVDAGFIRGLKLLELSDEDENDNR